MDKVYIFCPSLSNGGVEFLAYKIAVAMTLRHKKVVVVTLETDGPIKKRFLDADIELHSPLEGGAIHRLLKVISFIKDGQVLLLPSDYSYLLAPMLFFRKKIFVIDNFQSFIFRYGSIKERFKVFFRIVIINLFGDGVVFSYKEAKEKIKNRFFFNVRKTVIYHPVAPDFLETKACKTKDIDFIFVGRLEEEKGLMILIDALKILNEKFDLLPHVVIIGDGSKRMQLLDAIDENNLKNISYCGFVENPQDWIVRSKFLVLPSIREGCSGVVKEAVVLNVPSIVSDVKSKGPQEMIGYGKFGEIFESGNALDLAKIMKKTLDENFIYSNYDCRYAQNLRARLMYNFVAEKYDGFLDEC